MHPQWVMPSITTAFSSRRYLPESSIDPVPYEHSSQSCESLPIFTSSCPGWICFAEKTHPEVLQFISSTKSPQQIIGTIIKTILLSGEKDEEYSIFHVSVQPCFDKKLEASRLDFYHEAEECKEVDLVLSTTELFEMLADAAILGSDEGSISRCEAEIVKFLESIAIKSRPEKAEECQNMDVFSSVEHLFRCSSADGMHSL